MKNYKKLGLALLASLALGACTKVTKGSINEILSGVETGSNVKVQGTVYAVASDGYYINDSTENVFVEKSEHFKTEPTVGSKVTVTGTYAIANKAAKVKDITKASVKSGESSVTPVASSVSDILAMSDSVTGTFGKYVTVTGTIIGSMTNYKLIDDEGKSVIFSANSDASYKNLANKRVEIDVVVSGKTAQGFEVCYCGNPTTDKSFTLDQWKANVTSELDARMIKEIRGTYNVSSNLPTEHKIFPTLVKYEWASNSENVVLHYATSDDVSVLDYIEVKDVAEDETVTLTCTAHVVGLTETFEVPVTVTNKALKKMSISEFVSEEAQTVLSQINYSKVDVEGVVISKAMNQSRSLFGLILQDPAHPECTTQCDVLEADYKKAEIGKTVEVVGYYRTIKSGDRPTIQKKSYSMTENGAVTTVTVDPIVTISDEPAATSITYQPALVIDSEEKMVEFAANRAQYVGKVVKIENAKAVWCSSYNKFDPKSFVCLTYTEDKLNYAFNSYEAPIVLMYSINSEYVGSDFIFKGLSIAEPGESAVAYNVTLTVIPSYYDSNFQQLMIPQASCAVINAESDLINEQLYSSVEPIQAGDFIVPTSVTLGSGDTAKDFAISWTSGNEELVRFDNKVFTVDPETGLDYPEPVSKYCGIKQGNAAGNVTITAHFTVGETEFSFNLDISFLSPRSVSEQLANGEDNTLALVKGILVGYTQGGSFSSAGLARYGYILLDNATGEVIYTNNAQVIGGKLHTGFTTKDGTKIMIGDEVEIVGRYHVDTPRPASGIDNIGRHYVDLGVNEASVKILSSDNTIDLSKAIVVNNQAELEALFTTAVPYNKLIKIVANEENPLSFYTQGSQWNAIADLPSDSTTGCNLSFGYGKENNTRSIPSLNGKEEGSEYATNIKPSLGFQGNQPIWELAGKEGNWYSTLGYADEKKAAVTNLATGSFYAAIGYSNSNYYHFCICDPESYALAKYVKQVVYSDFIRMGATDTLNPDDKIIIAAPNGFAMSGEDCKSATAYTEVEGKIVLTEGNTYSQILVEELSTTNSAYESSYANQFQFFLGCPNGQCIGSAKNASYSSTYTQNTRTTATSFTYEPVTVDNQTYFRIHGMHIGSGEDRTKSYIDYLGTDSSSAKFGRAYVEGGDETCNLIIYRSAIIA